MREDRALKEVEMLKEGFWKDVETVETRDWLLLAATLTL